MPRFNIHRETLSALKIGQSVDYENVDADANVRASLLKRARAMGIKLVTHYYKRERVLHVTRIK